MTVCLNVATWFTLCHVLILSVTSTDLDLSGDHIPVAEGGLLTLSCNRTIEAVPPLVGVNWYRNTEKILQTLLRGDPQYTTNTSGYDEVSGRINVTTNQQTHKVMLQINASLDDGSVWKCGVDGHNSNNLTVEVLIPTSVATPGNGHTSENKLVTTAARHGSTSTVATPGNGHTPENKLVTTAARHGSTSTDKSPSCIPNVYAIVGSSAGTAIVCFLVVFTVICIKHIAGSREQDMNTINPGTSGLIPDDIGSDVNVQYSNIEIITEATGTDVNNKYNNSSVITGTTRSDVNNEYSTADVPSNEDRQYRCLTDTDDYITATFDLTEHID